jgi:hypothetical protein
VILDEDEHALLIISARSGARVALDHALCRQKVFDLLTEHGNIIILLKPVGALLPKAKALKTKTDACFATAFRVWSFVTFLRPIAMIIRRVYQWDGSKITLRRILHV